MSSYTILKISQDFLNPTALIEDGSGRIFTAHLRIESDDKFDFPDSIGDENIISKRPCEAWNRIKGQQFEKLKNIDI